MWSIGIVTVFYLVAAYAQVAGFGFDLETIAATAAAPVFALASPTDVGGYGSTGLLNLVIVVVFLDILAVGLGAAVASTHGVFALARDRRIPGALAKVSRRGTPIGAIVFVEGVSLLMVAFAQYWDGLFAIPETPHYFSMFLWLSTFGGFALMVVYGLLALGAFFGLWPHANHLAVVITGVIGVLVAVAAIFGGIYKQQNPFDLVWMYVLGWAILGVIVTLLVKGREPASDVLVDLRSSEEEEGADPEFAGR
jgi:amino acid transporter